MHYIHRDIELLLKKAFKQFPAVVLTGARQCGKSTLVKEIFPNAVYLSLDKQSDRILAKEDPENFLSGDRFPIIIDEIQEAPELLNYIKSIIDKKRKNGMFIITGSQQFSLMEGVQESLAGRTAVLDLSTFSFNEMSSKIKNKNWSEIAFNSSFPELFVKKRMDRDLWYSSYIRTFIDRDISKHLKEKNIYLYERFISFLAARFSREINFSSISNELGLDIKTIQSWLSFLIRSQVVFLLPPYFNNLGKRITKSPKLYFFDTGLVTYLTGYLEPNQVQKGPLAGAFFENLFISDIVKQYFSKGKAKNLYFYKENHGLEIDLIIDMPMKLKLFEIKSTLTPSVFHVQNLLKFQQLQKKDTEMYLITPQKEERKFKGVHFKNFLNIKV